MEIGEIIMPQMSTEIKKVDKLSIYIKTFGRSCVVYVNLD